MKPRLYVHPTFNICLLLAVIVALGTAIEPSTFAGSGNWNADAAGNWSDTTKWNPAAVPGTTAGDVVGLNFNLSAARIITLNTAATVGTLLMGDPTSTYYTYTLSGSSTLTFDNSGNGAFLRCGGTINVMSTPVALSDNLTIYTVTGMTNSGVISGSGYGLTKDGTSTLTLNGSAVNTYTGRTVTKAGTLILDLGNLSTPTDLINNGSTLTLGGGTLQIKQKSAATSSQTFVGTTTSANSTTAVIGTQVTSGALTINLGTITNSTSATMDFTAPTGGSIKVGNTNVNGILGGWATTNNTTSGTTVGGFAAVDGSGNITIPTYTSGVPSGTNNNNYRGANATLSGSPTVNSWVIDGSGDCTINGTLTLNSGGLFIGGTQRWLKGTGTIKSGLASGELYLHCNGSGYDNYQIWPDIADGAVATKVIKDGPGILKFWGNTEGKNKTYTGGTVVNGGTLQLSFSTSASGTGLIRGSLTINPGATVECRDIDNLGYTSASVSVTNVTINGGTLTASASGNQGFYSAFNLTGGTINSAITCKFGSAANCAINSLASPIISTIGGAMTLAGDITSLPITVASGTVPGGVDLTISGAIGGGSGMGITKSGAGTLELTATSTYSGLTTVSAGTVRLGSGDGGGTGTLGSSIITVASGAELDLNGTDVTGYGVTLALTNAGTIKKINSQSESLNRPIILTNGTISSTLSAASEAYNFLGNYIRTVAGTTNYLSGSGRFGLRTSSCYFTNEANSSLTISCVLQAYGGGGSAGTPLNKKGAGTLNLTAANTYTGSTLVYEGTLALTGSGSISSSTNLWVASGATLDVSGVSFTLPSTQPLSGAGTITGTVSVATGGRITSTNMSIEGLTFVGTATNNFNNPLSTSTAPLTVTALNGLNVGSTANAITINVPTTTLAAGNYHLIAYTGTIQGSAGITAFKLGTNPGGSIYSYTIVDSGGYVDLQVVLLADNWTGLGSTEWSANVLTPNKNWKYAGVAADYQNGKDVIFDDTATGTTTVDLSVADVTPLSVVFNNSASNYTLQGSAAIAGTTGLTKTGAGTVTINNVNKFTGAVTIGGGTLVAGNIANKGVNSALGAGTNITIGGATLSYTGGSASSDRPIAMTAGSALNVPSIGTSLTLTGAISGASGTLPLTKTGAGTLVLQNTANSYGATTINGGTVSVAENYALGTNGPVNFGGGTLAITGTSAFSSYKFCVLNAGGGIIQVDNLAGVTLNSDVSGTAGLTKTGTGTLIFNSSKTYSGGTTINDGVLDLTAGGGSAGVIRGTVTINANGTLRLSTGDATGYGTGSDRLATINITGGTLNISSTANQTLGNCTVNMTGGAITASNTSCNLDFYQGSSAVNSYASAVSSTISTTKLNLRQDNGVTFTVADGAADIDLDVSSVISASSGYTGNQLVKAGAGVMRLAGANTFAYPLNVGGGRLIVDGSLVSGCAVTVSNNATLGGSGTVNGTVTLQSGATLAAGGLGTNIGTLNIPNAITLNAGSTNYMRISKTGGTVTNDLVKGWTGTLSYAGTLQVVDVTSDATPLAYNDKFILFKNGAGNYGVTSFAVTNLPTPPIGLKWDLADLLVDGSIRLIYDNQATTPTIDPGSGSFIGSPSVTISSDPGSTILYTLDGSTPNSSSLSGASPLIVVIPTDAITVLNAIATNSGAVDSLMASATYNVIATPTWTNRAGGSWTTAANWSNSIVAVGTNVTADFSKLTLPAVAAVTLDGARTIGNLTFGDVGNTYGWTLNTGSADPLSLEVTSGSPTVNVVNQTATINAVLAGTTGLTKTGSGLLTLAANNLYTGGTVVNDGILRLTGGGAWAAIRGSVTVNSGANLRLSTVNALGWDTTATTVTNVSVVGGSVSNVTTGDQGFFTTYNLTGGSMQGGSGYWIFGSAANNAINSLASSTASVIAGNFYLKGDVANLPISTEAGSVPSGVDLEISGNITGDSGKGIVKSGAGTLKLDTGSSYSGGTIINSGALQLAGGGGGSTGALTNSAFITVASGAELQLNTPDATGYGVSNPLTNAGTIKQVYAFSETLNRPIILNGGTITSTASNAYNEAYNFFGGYIRTLAGTSNSITGVGNFGLRTSSCYFTNEAGSKLTIACPIQGWTGTGATPLNKTGAGTLELSASNIYAGNTVISGGTLALTGSGTIRSSSNIIANGTFEVTGVTGGAYSLASGQTLEGTGSVIGTVVVASGSILAPGASIGALTFDSPPTLAGTVLAELNPTSSPANADKIVISSGTLGFGGTLTVTNLGVIPTNGTIFDLFDGTLSGSFTTVNLPAGGATHWLTADLNVGGTIQFTNNTPTTTNLNTSRVVGLPIKVKKVDLAADADGDALTFTLTATTNGASLTQDSTYIYVPTNAVDDQFTVTVNDPYLGTNTATVTIDIGSAGYVQGITFTNGTTATIGFAGINGYPYLAERATNVAFTGVLRTWQTNAPPSGLFQIEDDFSDIGGPPGEAYYRMKYNP